MIHPGEKERRFATKAPRHQEERKKTAKKILFGKSSIRFVDIEFVFFPCLVCLVSWCLGG
jgi:hypothetical protein